MDLTVEASTMPDKADWSVRARRTALEGEDAMAVSRDLIVATTLLVGCGLVLVLALTDPAPVETQEPDSPSLAGAPTPPPVGTGQRPSTPPVPREPPPPVDRPSDRPVAQRPSSTGGLTTWDDLLDEDPPVIARPTPRAEPSVDEDDPPPLVLGQRPEAEQPRVPEASRRPPTEEPTTGPRPAATGEQRHVVARGETLMTISFQHYGTHQRWQAIRDVNQVDPDMLQVGQELRIPVLSDVVRARDLGTRSSDGRNYVVRRGDSYYTIARDQLGDATRHRELQRLNEIDPYDLRPGMRLTLPADAPQARASTQVSPAPSADRQLPAGARWHSVAAGEYLQDISQRYYGTTTRWRDIQEANDITDPRRIQVGTRLIIPDARGSAAATRPSASDQAASAGRGPGVYHEIQRGDVLGTISQRYYGTARRVSEIQAANPGINPSRLVVGDRLWIPGGQSVPSAGAARSESGAETPLRLESRRDPARSVSEADSDGSSFPFFSR